MRIGLTLIGFGMLLLLYVWTSWTYEVSILKRRAQAGATNSGNVAANDDAVGEEIEPSEETPSRRTSASQSPGKDRTEANNADTTSSSSGAKRNEPDPRKARLAGYWLLMGFALFILFVFGSYAIVRTARRLRAHMEKPPGPTDASDVWQLHKLPEEMELESEDAGGDNGPLRAAEDGFDDEDAPEDGPASEPPQDAGGGEDPPPEDPPDPPVDDPDADDTPR
jgi:hypothetical protein